MIIPECNLDDIRFLLKKKKIPLPLAEIEKKLNLINQAQDIFPELNQRVALIHLLHLYERSKRKVIILLEEKEEKKIPSIIHLSVLAEDWRGMANSILGIIHQKEGNVLYTRALTFPFSGKTVAIMLLAFMLGNIEEYNRFLVEKNNLISHIREASLGSQSKTLLLEDETVKFELYNQTVNRIRKIYKKPDLDNIIAENGEALKFFSSRSREYLEERKTSDLAESIIDNYRFQLLVQSNQAEKKIKIKNFETQYEKLTGITFVCWKDHFSIENFLKTLEFIVPNHIIKHHKSFMNQDGLLVYRIEIVDSEEKPLALQMIKNIEASLNKQIGSTANQTFSQFKSIGGFEHYARAIIPFLMEELQHTGITQVFMNADKRSEFLLDMKLLIVHFQSKKNFLNQLIYNFEKQKAIQIYSVIPPRVYKNCVEINILNLKINLSEFSSLDSIFFEIKENLKQVFSQIRDFDEGLRERDMNNLLQLKEKLKQIPFPLLKEIYFNFDEIYRIETQVPVMADIIRLCYETIKIADQSSSACLIVNYKNIFPRLQRRLSKTVFILTGKKTGKILGTLVRNFDHTQIYFTRFDWNQRTYLILTLKKKNLCLSSDEIRRVLNFILHKQKQYIILDDKIKKTSTME